MGVVRLEKFTPPTTHNEQPRFISPLEIEALSKEQYENGVKDGAAAASAAFSSEKSRCIGAIEESLADISFSTKEAHQAALVSLKPLVIGLFSALLPAMETAELENQIGKLIDEILGKPSAELIKISVSPTKLQSLSSIWGDAVQIIADDSLLDTQAHIHWAAGFNSIDLEKTKSAVESAISEYFKTLEQGQNKKVTHAR